MLASPTIHEPGGELKCLTAMSDGLWQRPSACLRIDPRSTLAQQMAKREGEGQSYQTGDSFRTGPDPNAAGAGEL